MTTLRATAWILAALALAAPGGAAPRFAGSELIVKFRDARGEAGVRRAAETRGVRVVKRSLVPGTVVVDGGKNPDATAARLAADPAVAYAVRNRTVSLAATVPDDTLFFQQWHLQNTGQGGGTPGADIQAASAWDITTGSQSVVLAVVDTGFEVTHPDLAARLWVNPLEIAGNGIDDDANGFVDDVNGWNFADNNNAVSDSAIGHGTAVAGTAGAVTNNATGHAGVDWNCRLMVAKVFGATGSASEADVVNGVVYAVMNGAKVVNASWGDGGCSPLLEDMAVLAGERGVLICAASGNNHFDNDENPFFPASLPYDSILSVGGSRNTDEFVYNYGLTRVGVSAPAVAIYQPRLFASYGGGNGTSYAAPQASGVAALVLAREPGLGPSRLKYRIMGGAVKSATLAGRSAGGGRLSAWGAVAAADTTAPAGIPDLAVAQVAHNGVILRFTAPADDGPSGRATFYQVRVSTAPVSAAQFPLLPETPVSIVPGAPGTLEQIVINDLDAGTTRYFAVRAVDAAGNAGPVSGSVSASLSLPATVFFDSCDTTNPAWTAAGGFELAPGPSKTGTLSWQDSPGGLYTSSTVATLTGGPFDISGLPRPRLSFELQHFIALSNTGADRFEVQASSDGGSSWTVLLRLRRNYCPFKRRVVPLDDFAGASSLMLRFVRVADADNFVDDGVYLDDIRVHDAGSPVPEFRQVILESTDFLNQPLAPPDYAETGNWTRDSSGKSAAPGVSSALVARADPGTTATARFTPFISAPGLYEVSVTRGAVAGASGVTCRIASSTGTAVLAISQDSLRDAWQPLAVAHLDYGRDPARGSLTLDASTATGGSVYSDAVRFRLIGTGDPPSRVEEWRMYGGPGGGAK